MIGIFRMFFYLSGEDDEERVCAEGRLLNQELVEEGLAYSINLN